MRRKLYTQVQKQSCTNYTACRVSSRTIALDGVSPSAPQVEPFSNKESAKARAADTLSKMTADKLMGPKARIALAKFLPDIFLDAIKKSLETGVQMFESTHENPELIWNDKTRDHMKRLVKKLAAE